MKKLKDSELVNVCGGIIIRLIDSNFIPNPAVRQAIINENPQRKIVPYVAYIACPYDDIMNHLDSIFEDILEEVGEVTFCPTLEQAETYAQNHSWSTDLINISGYVVF